MKTEFISITNLKAQGDEIRAAAKLLDNGGLVAFPTETVYGIGCSAEKSAVERLDKIKGRSSDKRYTLHVGSVEAEAKLVSRDRERQAARPLPELFGWLVAHVDRRRAIAP